eukprot:320410-Amphidinium_carterae.1
MYITSGRSSKVQLTKGSSMVGYSDVMQPLRNPLKASLEPFWAAAQGSRCTKNDTKRIEEQGREVELEHARFTRVFLHSFICFVRWVASEGTEYVKATAKRELLLFGLHERVFALAWKRPCTLKRESNQTKQKRTRIRSRVSMGLLVGAPGLKDLVV